MDYEKVGRPKQCLDVCTALSYSKNSRAGLDMPARPELLRYQPETPSEPEHGVILGTTCEVHVSVCSC